MLLFLKNLIFTLLVPGTVAGYVPWILVCNQAVGSLGQVLAGSILIYLGVLTAILGWAVLFRAPGVLLYALCVACGFHLFVVFYEEPHLRKVFGAEYEQYCARVARWLPGTGKSGNEGERT